MNKELEVSHKVLGLTGTEKEVEVKQKTFCQLCKRSLDIGDSALLLHGDNGWDFYIHVDCAVAQMTRIHNHIFREEVKVKNPKRKTRRKRKEVFQGDANRYCSFCHKTVREDQQYVKDGKKSYHVNVKNSCWTRYSRVMQNRRDTI